MCVLLTIPVIASCPIASVITTPFAVSVPLELLAQRVASGAAAVELFVVIASKIALCVELMLLSVCVLKMAACLLLSASAAVVVAAVAV